MGRRLKPLKFILRLDRSAEALRHPKADSRFLLCASRIVGMTRELIDAVEMTKFIPA
jgi:hypothetical protein